MDKQSMVKMNRCSHLVSSGGRSKVVTPHCKNIPITS